MTCSYDEGWDRNGPFLTRQALLGRGEHGSVVVDGSSESSRFGECVLVGLHHLSWELIPVLDSLQTEREREKERERKKNKTLLVVI